MVNDPEGPGPPLGSVKTRTQCQKKVREGRREQPRRGEEGAIFIDPIVVVLLEVASYTGRGWRPVRKGNSFHVKWGGEIEDTAKDWLAFNKEKRALVHDRARS